MKEDYSYKKNWQEDYAKRPHTKEEMDEGRDINTREFANLMMENFRASGILDLMKKEKVSMLASSVSTGERDWEVMQQLDNYLDEPKEFHRPSVTLTDFALINIKEENKRKLTIQKPEKNYKNLDAMVVACDSYHLPFKDNEFNVIYERLGALWHSAHEDMERTYKDMEQNGKGERGELIRNLLKEYKRVVKPAGKIIFDWVDKRRSMPPSTGQMIGEAIKPKKTREFLKSLGFEFEIRGATNSEMSIILTNPDKKSEK